MSMKDEPRADPDPVVEAYKKEVDRTLIRENLKLTVEERFRKAMELAKFADELRRAGDRAGLTAASLDRLARELNFTVVAAIGDVDLLGEILGGDSPETHP
jgi:hypothetical protein